jgi:hypothetical protein
MTRNEKLSKLFSIVWESFLDGSGLDGFEIEDMIEQCELATWREATQEDIDNSNVDLEEGDPILCLNEDGKKSIRIAHLTKLKESAK